MSAVDILDARHLVATAAGNIAACSAQVARALQVARTLSYLRGRGVSEIDDLETAIQAVEIAHRQLINAANELQAATRK